MMRVLSLLCLFLSAPALTGCISPAATTPNGYVWVPEPPEVKQYSDFLVGRYAYLTNDPQRAADSARRTAARAPEDEFLLERAVTFHLLAGETEQAVRLAVKGQSKVTGLQSVTRLALAADHFRNSRYKEARDRLTHGDMDMFNRMVARSLAAWAAVGEGDPAGAKTHLIESLVGDNLFDGINLYMLAFVQDASGDEASALETFGLVWEERMRLAIAAEHFARLLDQSGQREKAVTITRQFREEIGPNPAVDRISAQLAAGEKLDAKKLSPRDGASLALYAIGAALAAETQADFASTYFELALYINPDFDLARTMLSNTLDKAGRREEAVEILEMISESSPFFAASQGQLAWVLLRLDRDDEAVSVAQKAYDQTGDRDLAIQIGDINRALQNFDAAYDWFNRVVERDEAEGREDWRAYYARGLALSSLDRWEEAELDMLRSIEISGNQPEVLNYLGYTWVDRGENLEQAFKLIQRAVSLSPASGHIVDSLGWAYYRLGRYDLAVEHLEKAVSLAGGDPTINDHLGDAYWRAGRHLEAGFQWKHALELEPDETKKALIAAKRAHGLDGITSVKPPVQTAVAAETNPQQ